MRTNCHLLQLQYYWATAISLFRSVFNYYYKLADCNIETNLKLKCDFFFFFLLLTSTNIILRKIKLLLRLVFIFEYLREFINLQIEGSSLISCPSKLLQYRQLDMLLVLCLHWYATSAGLISDFKWSACSFCLLKMIMCFIFLGSSDHMIHKSQMYAKMLEMQKLTEINTVGNILVFRR